MSPETTQFVAAVAGLLGALAGCGWIGQGLYRTFFGGPERAANAAAAITGAAKLVIDELQEDARQAREEARQAREDARKAREDTESLRRMIAEERRLSEEKIARLELENFSLRQRNGQLQAQVPPEVTP